MKANDSEAPKLSDIKVQVLSIVESNDNSTLMAILDKHANGRRYLLRVLKREDESDDLPIERARAEAEASTKLGHPAILKIHDFRTVKSFFKVVKAEQLIEFVDAKPIESLLGQIEVKAGLLISQRIAAALSHMQRRQVTHGDLQPANVWLTRSGHVKVRGYGRSLIDEKVREKIQFHPNYAAPEQLKQKIVTPRTEVYNLGAVMYHLLTGQPPIADLRGRTEGQRLTMPSALNVKIPSALNNAVVACLQSNPERRPSDPYEVLQLLDPMVKQLGLDEEILAGLTASETS